ncbi:hypothetical protein VNI00_012947 [Paramarasmius palmivorus]|uniref:Uncharacterized protein n=1 Tax=Paramarasmius palmivorus TaxID=297713 RepID=A0AAW0BZP3_9AGAR
MFNNSGGFDIHGGAFNNVQGGQYNNSGGGHQYNGGTQHHNNGGSQYYGGNHNNGSGGQNNGNGPQYNYGNNGNRDYSSRHPPMNDRYDGFAPRYRGPPPDRYYDDGYDDEDHYRPPPYHRRPYYGPPPRHEAYQDDRRYARDHSYEAQDRQYRDFDDNYSYEQPRQNGRRRAAPAPRPQMECSPDNSAAEDFDTNRRDDGDVPDLPRRQRGRGGVANHGDRNDLEGDEGDD